MVGWLGCILAGGCAHSHSSPDATRGYLEDQSRASSALAFTPPIAMDNPTLDLSREPRQAAAFFGFQEPITEYYNITTIDRQVAGGELGFGGARGARGWGNEDRYERRAIIEKTGILRR